MERSASESIPDIRLVDKASLLNLRTVRSEAALLRSPYRVAAANP